MPIPMLSAKSRKSMALSVIDQLARHGLLLSKATLRGLEKRGVYCQTGISIEHQNLAGHYVLRATESGGAVADMGRYCGYLDRHGIPLPWLQPLDSLGGNGRHALIIGEELVRIEMLRIGRTYDLVISKHTLKTTENSSRPSLRSAILFRGREGTVAFDLYKSENRHLRGTVMPVFYTSSGEVRSVPSAFTDAIRKVTAAVSCLQCKHGHIATPPSPQEG